MDFEGFHRVLVIGGHENHSDISVDQLQDIEAAEFGHLHVEEYQVGFVLGNRFDSLESVGALRQNLNLGVGF